MHSAKGRQVNKLQKNILIVLLVLAVLTPTGIFLPMLFNAGDAWGEWSATTLKELIGFVPQGLAKYADAWKAPIADYTLNGKDPSVVHQSGYYIVSGIVGAMLAMIVTLVISKFIIRNGK
jgi:hypothetical protein